jgi:hypothetical protein
MNAASVIIVSDTHGFLDPRIARLAARCDYAVHAGDIGGSAVLQALRPKQKKVAAVRGNNDIDAKWPPKERALLRRLPLFARLALPGGSLGVVHGDRAGPVAARHERLRALYPDVRLIVYGHSHRMQRDCGSVPWVMNPGAAGRTRTYGGPSCMILKARAGTWRVRNYRFNPLP